MREARLDAVETAEDDETLWERQRAAQRSAEAALIRIAARPSVLVDVLAVASQLGGRLVGRAALGTSYLECDPSAVDRVRSSLPAGSVAVALDGSPDADRWGPTDERAVALMRRVKERFDPAGACNRGVFVGGI
jgi:hypothetical protein